MIPARSWLLGAGAMLGIVGPVEAGHAQTDSAQVPAVIEDLLANRTTDPRHETAQQPDPAQVEAAIAQGLRTDGFYWFSDTSSVDKAVLPVIAYFRFCPDGWVTQTRVSGELDVAFARSLLTCEPLNPQRSYGALRIEGSQLTFILTTVPDDPEHRGEVDYWVRIGPGEDILHFRSRVRGAQTYMQVQTRTLRFTPFRPTTY